MTHTIRQLSNHAENQLKHFIAGTVHSVYRRTINLSGNNQILSLQAAGSPLSPISLISTLSETSLSSVSICTGDAVTVKENEIEIITSSNTVRFSTAKAQRYDLSLTHTLERHVCLTLSKNIKYALNKSDPVGFSMLFQENPPQDLPLMLSAAKARIIRCAFLFHQEKPDEAAIELSRLLGLGIGLTPSGDDFLCGVLAGLILTGKDNSPFARRLKAEITRRLSDTIDISAAFLSCALQHQFSLAATSLAAVPAPEDILAAFEEIGHSSGMDTLCGVWWVLDIILNQKN